MLRLTLMTCALVLIIALTGCANAERGLQVRAAEYYNFMVGLSPKTSYSSFLTPLYRKSFTKDALKKLNEQLGKAQQSSNTRYKPVKPEQVSVLIESRFAFSNVGNEMGQAFASVGPVRWVKVGSKWYLYASSGGEQAAYGSFPNGFSPPAPPSAKPPASAGE